MDVLRCTHTPALNPHTRAVANPFVMRCGYSRGEGDEHCAEGVCPLRLSSKTFTALFLSDVNSRPGSVLTSLMRQ